MSAAVSPAASNSPAPAASVAGELLPTPSQTVGPFYGYALPFAGGGDIAPPGRPGTVVLHGHVLDGAGEPVPDALIEVWQPAPDGSRHGAPGSLRRDPVTGAVIGEQWAIGDALLQVTKPRTPCTTFAGFWGMPDLIKRFTARAAPGAYLRVLREGEVGAGDPVEVVARPEHGVTIGQVFRAMNLEPELLPRLLDAPELPEPIREKIRRRLSGSRP